MKASNARSRYCWTALLADALSFLRLGVALTILWLGWMMGRAALPAVVLLATTGWVGDGLDGPIARRSPCPTRLAKFDYPLDVILTWAEFVYAMQAGFIPPVLILIYSAISFIATLWFRRKAVLVLFMRGIDGIVLYLALRYAPLYVLPLLIWLFILAIVLRQRLQRDVPRWLHELVRIFRLNHQPQD